MGKTRLKGSQTLGAMVKCSAVVFLPAKTVLDARHKLESLLLLGVPLVFRFSDNGGHTKIPRRARWGFIEQERRKLFGP